MSRSYSTQDVRAQVLGNLLGHGDDEFTAHVKQHIKPENVCYLGVNDASKWEQQRMQALGLRNISPTQLAQEVSAPLLQWFKATGAKYLAIHLDLDVLDPSLFRALLFSNTDYPVRHI
ncbi:arginase family protein [Shewanella sp.]|uniref:arginase family protein n=1 Tax=Shewanella sp. TaxID=50422 RepID=UPI003A969336